MHALQRQKCVLPGSLTGDMPAALVSTVTASPQDSAKLFVGTDDGFIMGYQMAGDTPGTHTTYSAAHTLQRTRATCFHSLRAAVLLLTILRAELKHSTRAHFTCITSLMHHPSRAASLLLSASMDGCVKLWGTRLQSTIRPSMLTGGTAASTAAPRDAQHLPVLQTFEAFDGIVTCAQWAPTLPTVFSSCDSQGGVCLFRLAENYVDPVATLSLSSSSVPSVPGRSPLAASPVAVPHTAEPAVATQLVWSPDSRIMVVGDAACTLHCVRLHPDFLSRASKDDISALHHGHAAA